MEPCGYYRGRHYTWYVDDVRLALREGRLVAAEALLLALLEAVEEENAQRGTGAAPWYYKKLAHIYRLQGNLDAEVAVIERYNRQPHARPQSCFEERLADVYRYAAA